MGLVGKRLETESPIASAKGAVDAGRGGSAPRLAPSGDRGRDELLPLLWAMTDSALVRRKGCSRKTAL